LPPGRPAGARQLPHLRPRRLLNTRRQQIVAVAAGQRGIKLLIGKKDRCSAGSRPATSGNHAQLSACRCRRPCIVCGSASSGISSNRRGQRRAGGPQRVHIVRLGVARDLAVGGERRLSPLGRSAATLPAQAGGGRRDCTLFPDLGRIVQGNDDGPGRVRSTPATVGTEGLPGIAPDQRPLKGPRAKS